MKNVFGRFKLGAIQGKNFLRYSLYAIGEIILIVVGILIALELGNRNEDKAKQAQERRILTDLKNEIQNNLEGLNHVIREKEDIVNICKIFLNATGPKVHWDSKLKFDSLLVKTLVSGWKFKPETGVLNEILNSGKLDVIKNDSLRYAISSLPGYMARFQFEDDMVIGDLHNSYLPFVMKHYPVKNTNIYKSGDLTLEERKYLAEGLKSRFNGQPEILLNNLEFENQLNIQMLWVSFSLFHYNQQLSNYHTIISMIDKEF